MTRHDIDVADVAAADLDEPEVTAVPCGTPVTDDEYPAAAADQLAEGQKNALQAAEHSLPWPGRKSGDALRHDSLPWPTLKAQVRVTRVLHQSPARSLRTHRGAICPLGQFVGPPTDGRVLDAQLVAADARHRKPEVSS